MQKIRAVSVLALCIFSAARVSVVHAAVDVEKEVRSFFEDAPIMIEIARCESKFKQFGNDGLALRGGFGGGMIGVFQIYERVHANAAQKLGFDLATLDGNLSYAKHLYEASGPSPWNSSKTCWQHTVTAQKAVDIRTLEKRIIELQKLVAQLQRLLDQKRST